MLQVSRVLLSSFLVSTVCAAPSDSEVSSEPERESPLQTEQRKDSRRADGPFRWLSAGAEMVGQDLGKLRLKKLRSSTGYGPGVETEQEVTEEGERTTRIVLRAYSRDPQGRRQLVEVVEDEWTMSPDGIERAVRTTSIIDINGRMRLVGRETQETVPQGSNAFRTVTTFERPNTVSSLTPVERVEQTERRRGENAVEIERTVSLVDPNGGWRAAVRRTGYIQESGGVIQTDESIYRVDYRGRLSLSEQVVSLEWQENDGSEYRTIETQVPNLYGKLEVVRELTIARTVGADGSSQTVQETATRSVTSPSDELQLVERIVETDSSRGGLRETSVEASDGTGQLRTVSSFRTLTTRSPDGTRMRRKVD